MGWDYVGAVEKISDEYQGDGETEYTGLDRVVLIDLADRTDDKKYCYPSVMKISKRIRFSVSSVNRSLVNLERLKLVKIEPGTERLTNTYTIDLELIRSLAPTEEQNKGRKRRRTLDGIRRKILPDGKVECGVCHTFFPSGGMDEHISTSKAHQRALGNQSKPSISRNFDEINDDEVA